MREKIFSMLKFDFKGEIEICESKNVYAELKNGKGYVGGSDKSSLARAYMLFAYNCKKGNGDFKIEQTAAFKNRGVMLDFSRNGVMRVEKVKQYIDYMALHGLNTLYLYMEDVYEIPGYDCFGYMRGRYSREELKEIDDYGYEMGVELIPCVQFLGHLAQYLRWQEADSIRDTASVLMIDEEKTYEFITAAVKSLRECFRTDKLHVGMDEAHDVGLGNYLLKNGLKNRFEIMNRHISEVLKICSKYNFKPMMWSDMYFRLGNSGAYYADENWDIDKEVADNIPDIDMVYWDYYHEKKEDYRSMVQAHKKLGKRIFFAGGLWMWDGFLPNYAYTLKSMIPAMQVCVEEGIENVFLTEWEDDGCETNHFMSIPSLAVISEYCFVGKDVSEDEIKDISSFIIGEDYEAVDKMSDFHNGEVGDTKVGKRYIWSDFLYNFTNYTTDYEKTEEKFLSAYNFFNGKSGNDLYEYAALLFKTARGKSILLRTLRNAYLNNDKAYLEKICKEILPDLKSDYIKLHKIHKKQWLETYKPFGWETLDIRYAALEARADYAAERISDYLSGKINKIEELEEQPLAKATGGRNFGNLMYTSLIR